MAPIETSITIDAPPQRVFDAITDLSSASERISGIKTMEVLTEGPFGVGTRFRETRVIWGKEATEEMEVAEITPGEGYILKAENHGCLYTSWMKATPEGEGSRLTMGFEGKGQSFVANLAIVVMGPFMKGQTKKLMAQDLADIKAALEGD